MCGTMPRARSPAIIRPRQIGVIIPTLRYAIYAGFVEGLQESLRSADYSLLIATSGYDLGVEAEHGRVLIERGVEGLVLVGARRKQSLADLLKRKKIPVAATYVYDPTSQYSTIGIDNVGIAEEMVDRLADLGHREFCHDQWSDP